MYLSFKSIFKKIIRVSSLLILLSFICLNMVSSHALAQNKSTAEDRRNARVQATYITRLVKFIRWEGNSTAEQESFKIVVLGDENLGLVKSLNFLVEQSNLSADGHPVKVFHFPNIKCVMGEQISVFFSNLFHFGQTLEKFSILAIVKRAKKLLDFRTLMQNF